MIRQICSIKPEDVARVRSSELLAKLQLEDLDLILRERRLRWFGHVARSSGAIRTAYDMQIDGKRGAGRPKQTWKKLTEKVCREWKLTTVQGSKIVLVRSYLRVSQAAGQVNILIFLLEIKFSPCMLINFVMQGKCLFSDISRPAVDPQERSTLRSGVRSAMRAASQLPGKGPTDVDDAPAPAR